jgi:hypothetical protein
MELQQVKKQPLALNGKLFLVPTLSEARAFDNYTPKIPKLKKRSKINLYLADPPSL